MNEIKNAQTPAAMLYTGDSYLVRYNKNGGKVCLKEMLLIVKGLNAKFGQIEIKKVILKTQVTHFFQTYTRTTQTTCTRTAHLSH